LHIDYTHLTEDERYQIYESLAANVSQAAIARLLGRSASTIFRKLQRNRGHRGFRLRQAQGAVALRQAYQNGRQITDDVWEKVDALLGLDLFLMKIALRTGIRRVFFCQPSACIGANAGICHGFRSFYGDSWAVLVVLHFR